MLVKTDADMIALGEKLGQQLRGGEVIELIGDVGAGKTTFAHGLAIGLGVTDAIQSPSFTIVCNYPARDELTLNHYDFYRLADAGIMRMELAETIANNHNVTVIEWGDSIADLLPLNHIVIHINYLPTTGRAVTISLPSKYSYIQI